MPSASKIRVLLALTQERLGQALMKKIDSQPDMEVVGIERDNLQILLRARETAPEVIVVTMPDSGEEPPICSHLFAEYSDLAVVAISRSGSRSALYRQIIHRQELPSASPRDWLDGIRLASREVG